MVQQDDAVPAWLRELAQRHAAEPGHGRGCPGTLRHITPEARLRGAASVVQGGCVSLSRTVAAGGTVRPGEQRPSVSIETFVETRAPGMFVGSDRVELDCHGVVNTHLDGLNHIGMAGQWHDGSPCDDPSTASAGALMAGTDGIATRVICLDFATGTEQGWARRPIGAAELERALEATGIGVEPGDALMVYMGRDVCEAAGHTYDLLGGDPQVDPGISRSGGEWIAEHRISVLCWDFLDAAGPGPVRLPVHAISWAVGLMLIDNCDLGPAARALRAAGRSTGLLSVGPLRTPGATGSMVNPVVLY